MPGRMAMWLGTKRGYTTAAFLALALAAPGGGAEAAAERGEVGVTSITVNATAVHIGDTPVFVVHLEQGIPVAQPAGARLTLACAETSRRLMLSSQYSSGELSFTASATLDTLSGFETRNLYAADVAIDTNNDATFDDADTLLVLESAEFRFADDGQVHRIACDLVRPTALGFLDLAGPYRAGQFFSVSLRFSEQVHTGPAGISLALAGEHAETPLHLGPKVVEAGSDSSLVTWWRDSLTTLDTYPHGSGGVTPLAVVDLVGVFFDSLGNAGELPGSAVGLVPGSWATVRIDTTPPELPPGDPCDCPAGPVPGASADPDVPLSLVVRFREAVTSVGSLLLSVAGNGAAPYALPAAQIQVLSDAVQFGGALPEGSLNTTNDLVLTLRSLSGTVRDELGNEAQLPGDLPGTDDFKCPGLLVDTSSPSALRFQAGARELLSGTPTVLAAGPGPCESPLVRFSVSAADNHTGALSYTSSIDGVTVSSAGFWDQDIWRTPSDCDAGGSRLWRLSVMDTAGNRATATRQFCVDNPRVMAEGYGLATYVDFAPGGPSASVPAGYPGVSWVARLKNAGALSIPDCRARLTIAGSTYETAKALLPPNGTALQDFAALSIAVPSVVPPGALPVMIRQARDGCDYDDANEPDSLTIPIAVVSSQLVAHVSLPESVDAGATLPVTYGFRQRNNGGVSTDPRLYLTPAICERNEGLLECEFGEPGYGLPVSAAVPSDGWHLLPGSSSPEFAVADPPWRVPLDAPDGTTIRLGRSALECRTDQLGLSLAPDGERVWVEFNDDPGDTSASVVVMNSSLGVGFAESGLGGMEVEDMSLPYGGAMDTLYLRLSNARPRLEPRLKILLSVPNNPGRFSLETNAGVGWKSLPGARDQSTWIYDPGGGGGDYPFLMSGEDLAVPVVFRREDLFGVAADTVMTAITGPRLRDVTRDTLTIRYFLDSWAVRSVCRTGPDRDWVRASDRLAYQLTLRHTGSDARAFLYFNPQENGIQEGSLGLSFGGTPVNLVADPARPGWFRTESPLAFPQDSPRTYTLEASPLQTAEDRSRVGFHAEDIRVRIVGEGSDVPLAEGECSRELRPDIHNVRLRASLSAPAIVPAGRESTLRVSVKNVGRLDYPGGGSLVCTEDWIEDLGSAVGPCRIDPLPPLRALTVDSSLCEWRFRVAPDHPRQDRKVWEMFAEEASWAIAYDPACPSPGCAFRPNEAMAPGGGDVHFSAPQLSGTASQDRAGTIPEGEYVALRFRMANDASADQAEAIKLDFPDGPLPSGLIFQSGPTAPGPAGWWPADWVSRALAPGEHWDSSYVFRVARPNEGRVVSLHSTGIGFDAGGFPCSSTISFEDLTVGAPTLQVHLRARTDSVVVAGSPLIYEYEIVSSSAADISPTVYLAAPSGWPRAGLAVDSLCITGVVGGRRCVMPPEFPPAGQPLTFGGDLKIAAGTSARLRVRLGSGVESPDSMPVLFGFCTVRWRDQEQMWQTAEWNGSAGAVVRNVRLRPQRVTTTSATPVAGGNFDYVYRLRSDGSPWDPRALPLRLHVRPAVGLSWPEGGRDVRDIPFDAESLAVTMAVQSTYPDSALVTPGDTDACLSFGSHPHPPLPDSCFTVYDAVRPRNVHLVLDRLWYGSDQGQPGDAGRMLYGRLLLRNLVGHVDAQYVSPAIVLYRGGQRLSLLSAPDSNVAPFIAAGGSSVVRFDIPLHADAYEDGAQLRLDSLIVLVPGQVDPPARLGAEVLDEAPPVTVANLALRAGCLRLWDLAGSPRPAGRRRDPVNRGQHVAYGCMLQNLGHLDQDGPLSFHFQLPGATGALADICPSTMLPAYSVPDESLSVSLGLSFVGIGRWATQSDTLRLEGCYPAFSVLVDSSYAGRYDQVSVSGLTVTGSVPNSVAHGVRGDVTFRGLDPEDVPVYSCGVADLAFEYPESTISVGPGTSFPVLLRISYDPERTLGIPGDIQCTLELRDPAQFAIERVDRPVPGLGGTSRDSVLQWSLERCVIRSGMLRDRAGRPQDWRIRLHWKGGAGRELTGDDLLSFVAEWRLDDGETNVPCGFGGNDIVLPGVRDSLDVVLVSAGGALTNFFAKPNPARNHVDLCYELGRGVSSVRLLIMDLAGDVLLASSNGSGMGMEPRVNAFRWEFGESVANGVYLARLDLDGVDPVSGRSLRETRRVRFAVFK